MGKVIYQLILATLCVFFILIFGQNKQIETITSLVNSNSGEFVADTKRIFPEIIEKIFVDDTEKEHVTNAAETVDVNLHNKLNN